MQFQFFEYRVPGPVAAGDWGVGHKERVETPVHVDTLALSKENNFRKLLWKRKQTISGNCCGKGNKQFQQTVVEKETNNFRKLLWKRKQTISGNCCGKD